MFYYKCHSISSRKLLIISASTHKKLSFIHIRCIGKTIHFFFYLEIIWLCFPVLALEINIECRRRLRSISEATASVTSRIFLWGAKKFLNRKYPTQSVKMRQKTILGLLLMISWDKIRSHINCELKLREFYPKIKSYALFSKIETILTFIWLRILRKILEWGEITFRRAL